MRQIKHSQNFVKDQKLLESLIRNSSIFSEDLVFDFEAGNGEITEILRKYCKEVIAIEEDKKLVYTVNSRI